MHESCFFFLRARAEIHLRRRFVTRLGSIFLSFFFFRNIVRIVSRAVNTHIHHTEEAPRYDQAELFLNARVCRYSSWVFFMEHLFRTVFFSFTHYTLYEVSSEEFMAR